MNIIPEKIEIDFTDEKITPSAGSIFIACLSRMFKLPKQIKQAIKLKKRNRGASDVEMVLSLIYSLAQGDGALSDVDRLKEDEARCKILGFKVPDSHVAGKLVRHTRKWKLSFSKSALRIDWLYHAAVVIESSS